MADGRDIAVWSKHAQEHRAIWTPHIITEDIQLRKWLKQVNPKECLDYGCGSGLWRGLFEGFNYTGADQNNEMIAAAKDRYPAHADSFYVIEWDKPYFPDGTFDLIFTSAVLQHNLHPQKARVVEQIVRMLKPGGHFMCTENTFRPDNYKTSFPRIPVWREDLDDGYSLTSIGWEKFMKARGLTLLSFSSPSEYLYVRS